MKSNWLKSDETSQNIALSSQKILMKAFVSVWWLRRVLSAVVLWTVCPVLLCVAQCSVCVLVLVCVLNVLLWCHELECVTIQGVSNKVS
jgi:hypothetical protein